MEPARLSATDLACRRGERLLFRGLSFALSAGEALQVIGPNGTGKSSLLRILAGLLRPEAGTIELNRQAATIAYLNDFRVLAVATVVFIPLLFFMRRQAMFTRPSRR